MTEKNTLEKTRQFLIRRQTWIYMSLIVTGITLFAFGLYRHPDMIAQGIAFIIVGCVGMIMSWTTNDIGNEIKEEIRAVGKGVADLNEGFGEMNATLKEIREILKNK